MNTRINWALALALFPAVAIADAYVCQNGTQKTIQSEPCSSQQNTKKAISSAPAISQEQSAAAARKDLDRQVEWLNGRYQEQAVEMAARQEVLRQDAARQAAYQQQQQQQQQQRQAAAQQQAAIQEAQRQRYLQSVQAPQPNNPMPSESFANNGRMLRQPAGSSFEYDNRGNAYHRPEGSAFSYGKGGVTCFHYGAFADCK